MNIQQINAREIFDSNGFPALECEILLDNDCSVIASVPCGTSRSTYEAIDLRDGDERLAGMGLHKAIQNIEKIIAPALIGHLPDVVELDLRMLELDSTENKAELGANTMLAVSMAVCKAQALINEMKVYELIAHLCGSETVTLPFAMFNIINGGKHARNKLLMQEIMIMPVGAQSFRHSLEWATDIFRALEKILRSKKRSTALGIEGGFSSDFANEKEALDLLMQAMEQAGVTDSSDVVITLDAAASSFYDAKKKVYKWHEEPVTTDEMIELYEQLTSLYPICSIEDGLAADDRAGWKKLTASLGGQVQIVGDDIFATNPLRIAEGISDEIANAAVIKPNQIGTVTEVLQALQLCQKYNIATVVSHRSGETEDNFIIDLALGSNAGQIKAGGCLRGERISKYNHLLRIEDSLVSSVMGL